MKIKSTRVLIDGKFVPKTLHLAAGKITHLSDEIDVDIEYGDHYIVPGFIDVHLHGCYGVNSMDDSYRTLQSMSTYLPWEGVTTFLPTTTTVSDEELLHSLDGLGRYIKNQNKISFENGEMQGKPGVAEVYGIHLEGPFLASKYAGAQKAQYLSDTSIEKYQIYQSASHDTIKYITLAPEQDHAQQLTNYIRQHEQQVIVSLGHTGATYEQAKESIDAGATSITHLFNGMVGLHHREPGIVLNSLLDDRVYVQLTLDGHHINYDLVRLIIKNKGIDKVVLITDSNQTKGLIPGHYNLNGREIVVGVDGTARLQKNGSLAGSTIKMIDCVKNLVMHCGVSLEHACMMASLTPATMLHIDDHKGKLALQYDADIVVLDDKLEIVDTICRGKVAVRNS